MPRAVEGRDGVDVDGAGGVALLAENVLIYGESDFCWEQSEEEGLLLAMRC